MSRSAVGVLREIIAVTVPLILAGETALGTGGPRYREAAADAREGAVPPVVLVHGLGGLSTSWYAVRSALRADGRTVVSFDYSPWGSSVEKLADRLTDTVEELLAATGAGRVHLLGHSLGGVIIAQALTRHRLARHVDVVVTLGSPFGGSPWAALLPTASLVRALRPGSPLLRRLAAFPPPAGVRWLAFASTLDPIVPADRAVPAHRQATCVTVDGVGHTGMLLDRDVIARILAAIQVTGEATDEGDVRAA
jgi:pimeloyl-ACP methyl ester carboxylesterase